MNERVEKIALIDTECSIDCLLFSYFNKLNSTCFVCVKRVKARKVHTAAHNKWNGSKNDNAFAMAAIDDVVGGDATSAVICYLCC